MSRPYFFTLLGTAENNTTYLATLSLCAKYRSTDELSATRYFGTSVEYPAMGVARYCWSVVVVLSEMMSRQSDAVDLHGTIQPTAWLVMRTTASSNRQWCAVRRSTCSSWFEE